MLEKKFSFEYVSLSVKAEELMEMSNGDTDNPFTLQLNTRKVDCDLKSVWYGIRDEKCVH